MKKITCFLPFILIVTWINLSVSQSWNKLNGPTGAIHVHSLITYQKGEIFILVATGKILRSIDNANNWEDVSKGIEFSTQAIVNQGILKESPTGEIFFARGHFLYKFNQITKSWESKNTVIEIEDYSFSPDGNRIYIADSREMRISNNGSSFIKVQDWWTHSVEFLCIGNNNNYVRRTLGASGEIWKFNDDGTNLRIIKDSRSHRKLFFHKSTNTLYDIDYEISFSKDHGLTWQLLKLPNSIYFNNLLELNDGNLAGINNNVWKTSDNGLNWTIDSSYNVNNIPNLYSSGFVSISKDGEILVSSNNTSYLLSNKKIGFEIDLPLTEPHVNSIFQYLDKNIIANIGSNTQLSTDDGQSWNKLPISNYSNIFYWDDGTLAVQEGSRLKFSADGFKTFIEKQLPALFIFEQLFKDNQGNLVLLSSNDSQISYDKGDTWNIIGSNINFPFSLNPMKISKQNIIYYASYNDSLYYTNNYGLNWNSFFGGVDDLYPFYLSINNVFFWYARDNSTFETVPKYSVDLGVTIEDFPLQQDEYILHVDDYDNVYTCNSFNPNSIKVTNLLTKQISSLKLDGLDLKSSESFEIIRGDNGYLYAIKYSSPIYKYSEKQEINLSQISGKLYIDENFDCLKNANESTPKPVQLEIKSKNRSYSLPVLKSGDFKAFVTPDNYSIELKSGNIVWEECNFPSNINISLKEVKNVGDLVIRPRESCAWLNSGLALGRLRRCFENNTASLTIKNDGSVSAINTLINVVIDDYFENVSSSISPISINGNIWTFEIPEIKVDETFRINFLFKISCKAELSQLHCIKAIVNNPKPCNGIQPLEDTLVICEKNIGSFDPNDITAYIHGVESETYYKDDKEIDYLIRFQNTGTDTAFNIVIKNKLDINFDWTSILVSSASHNYQYQIDEKGEMSIYFNNIMLADSNISEINSHGYFKYSIKPKTNIKVGTLMHNKAEIYFDFNEPVHTNVSKVKVGIILKKKEIASSSILQLKAIPNPFTTTTRIRIPEDWDKSESKINIYSSTGLLLNTSFIDSDLIVVNRDMLPDGVYFVEATNKKGRKAFCKLVVK